MALTLDKPWIEDVRNPVAGDSYNWAGIEPAPAKKSIVIHHTGTHTSAGSGEDAFSIANYHVNHNGWGGVGYHFVITHDNHGAVRVQYAGDLLTYRAHVLNNNPGRVGICLVGNFEQELPGPEQLKACRMLINFLLEPNNILPSLNYFSQIVGHGDLMATGCPGKTGPHFGEWFNYLKGGEFPAHLYGTPAVTPALPPEPVVTSTIDPVPIIVYEEAPPTPEPISVLDNLPDYELSYRDNPRVAITNKLTTAFNLATGEVVAEIPQGTRFDVAGTMTSNGQLYVRSVYSKDHDLWNGVPAADLEETPIPVTVEPTPVIETPTVEIPIAVEKQVDGITQAPPVSQPEKPRFAIVWLLVRIIGSVVNKLIGR